MPARRILAMTGAVALGLVTPASAQDTAGAADPAAAFAPFYGEWVGRVTLRGPDGSQIPVGDVATWSFEPAMGGRAVIDKFELAGRHGVTLAAGITTRAYDAERARWVMTYLNLGDADALAFEGAFVDGIFEAVNEGEDANGPFKARIRLRLTDPDHFVWTMDRSYDGGTTWIAPFATLTARRDR